jgi:hypothetical protein
MNISGLCDGNPNLPFLLYPMNVVVEPDPGQLEVVGFFEIQETCIRTDRKKVTYMVDHAQLWLTNFLANYVSGGRYHIPHTFIKSVPSLIVLTPGDQLRVVWNLRDNDQAQTTVCITDYSKLWDKKELPIVMTWCRKENHCEFVRLFRRTAD